jgi:molybdopterin-guanine dinucleotide biosynthesis protein A
VKLEGVEGFILAGGMSRRMGSPKALLDVGGKPIIARVGEALREAFESVRVVTDRPEEVAFLGLPMLPDVHTGKGPLGGLHAALTAAQNPTIFIASADMPFLTASFVQSLQTHHQETLITIPWHAGSAHPLCCFYDRTVLSNLTAILQTDDWSVRKFVERLNPRIIQQELLAGFDLDRQLFNVNTPKELERARRMAMSG